MEGPPDLARFDDEFAEVLRVFQATARALVAGDPALRAAVRPSPALLAAAHDSLSVTPRSARAFFAHRFTPRWLTPPPPAEIVDLRPRGPLRRVQGERPRLATSEPHEAEVVHLGRPQTASAATDAPRPASAGFLTGYYEPVVEGALAPSARFTAPILARPPDLVSFAPGEGPRDFDPTLAGARRRADGGFEPYPERAKIEDAGHAPIVWLEDAVEVFLIQVQGSARVNLPDGRQMRLVYDGRNGLAYTSIGRWLIDAGEIPESEMSLARLKAWLRAHGLRPGEPGRELMRRNRSYIFFRLEEARAPAEGPIGGAGVPLTPLRSIAVDRTRWSYGLPFWIEAELPEGPFRRLMIAQDTGSAIVGEARFDLFFGSGPEAGVRAGAIRHPCRASVLEPKDAAR